MKNLIFFIREKKSTTMGSSVFREHEASNMETQKRNRLHYPLNALSKTDDIVLINSLDYKRSQKTFRDVYQNSWKRWVSAMYEAEGHQSQIQAQDSISKNKTALKRKSACEWSAKEIVCEIVVA